MSSLIFIPRVPSTLCTFQPKSSNHLGSLKKITTSGIKLKTVPSNLKGKSVSSQNWLKRQLNDEYVLKSRYANYRARSAWKLIQIDDSHKILSPGQTVVELGAAPGAWTQVLVERLGLTTECGRKATGVVSPGMIVAVDLNPIHPVEGAHVLPNCDFTKPINQSKVFSLLDGRPVDIVLSDMAPNASGKHSLDHEAIIQLVYAAFTFSIQVLRPTTGVFLTKIWDGSNSLELDNQLKKFFKRVDRIKPDASRENSSELFILARDFTGLSNKVG